VASGCGEFLGLKSKAGLDLVLIAAHANLGPGLLGVGFLVILLVDFLGEATFNSLNVSQECGNVAERKGGERYEYLPVLSWERL
jgi:hypothetical protein